MSFYFQFNIYSFDFIRCIIYVPFPPVISFIVSSIGVIIFSSIRADTNLWVSGPNGDSSILLKIKKIYPFNYQMECIRNNVVNELH